MPLQKLTFNPGLNRENTRYANEGRWWSMDRARFCYGTIESIGGWQKFSTSTFVGVCRFLWNWITLGSENLLAVGTNLKLYVVRGGLFHDLTPARLSIGALTNPFATTSGSATVTFTYTAHGAYVGDFVTFSGATGFNGIATATLNTQYQIVSVPTADTFTMTMTTASGTGSGGGAAVVATFQIHTGPATAQYGTGWGISTWGGTVSGVATVGWGQAASNSGVITQGAASWVGASFGQDFACAQRFGTLYYWQPTFGGSISNAVNTPIATLNSIASGSGFPTNNPLYAGSIVVTDSQFMIIGGSNPVGSTTFDPLTIRWCDEGNSFSWNPLSTNQAGDYRLSSGSSIYCMKLMRQEVLVWTDTSLISMQYVGAPIVFSFTTLLANSSLASPTAVVTANNAAYWMSNGKFHMYDGAVHTLQNPVRSYVFDNMNMGQMAQVYAGANSEFNEVTWFYCSKNATFPDSYVTYNYVEQLWMIGTMTRSAWLQSTLLQYPIAASNDGYLYNHEQGLDDGSTSPAQSLNSYVESAGVEIGEGSEFSFVSRILPDVDFSGSTAKVPTVSLTLTARDTAGSGFLETDSNHVQQTTTVPFSQFTPMCYTRIRGRQIVFRLDCNTPGTNWTMGVPRIDIRPDGRR